MKVRLTTSLGSILLELDASRAPETVANFKRHVESGHYEGTIFHRVIEDFMIQGGGLDATLNERATKVAIENEADNGLSNLLGTVAMARTGEPHSARAQFFINTADNAFLDHQGKTADEWGYCVFGKVIAGMEVVEEIEACATTTKGVHQDVPEETITIEKAGIVC